MSDLDIYILFHVSHGVDTVFRFPFSTMNSELDHYETMFHIHNTDGIKEMYRHLQLRATSTVLNLFSGHGKNEYIYPRNYYVSTPNGFDMEKKQDHTYFIPIIDTDMVYDRYFQIVMLTSTDNRMLPFDEHHELITMTIPDGWFDMSEEEKEYKWEEQIRKSAMNIYTAFG